MKFSAVALDNASAYGGAGADTINMRSFRQIQLHRKGNGGDDVIRASDVDADTIATTIFGGQGDDTVSSDLTDLNVAQAQHLMQTTSSTVIKEMMFCTPTRMSKVCSPVVKVQTALL